MATKEDAAHVISGINELRERLAAVVQNATNESNLDTSWERLSRWKARAVQYLTKHVSQKEGKQLEQKRLFVFVAGDHLNNLMHEANLYEGLLKALVEEIVDDPTILSSSDAVSIDETQKLEVEPKSNKSPEAVAERCVFIGHGRSALWAKVQLFIQNELKLKTVNYESESRIGDTIVPVLEKMLSQSTFAVLVLTAEDETAIGSKRARQNVVHEAGLFQGKLGFKKAILLMQEGIEEFSNIAGLQYIPFSGDQVSQTFYELQRVLKREGQL